MSRDRVVVIIFMAAVLFVVPKNARAEEPLPVVRLDEIDLREAPLRDALALIGESAGVNLAASDDAAKTKVTIHLRNMPPFSAVQAICQTQGLFFNKRLNEDGIDIVTTVKEYQEGLTVFREEKTQVYTMLYPNAIDLAVAIRDVFGTRVQLSLGKEGIYNESDEIQRRFERFDLIDSRSQGLATSFSAGGNSSSSGGGGNSSSGGNSSGSNRSTSGGGGGGSSIGALNQRVDVPVVDQRAPAILGNMSPDQLARASALIGKDGMAGVVDSEKLGKIGRNNNSTIHVSVLNRNNQIVVRTSDPGVIEEIDRLKAQLDIPTPQVLLEVKVLSVELSDGFNSVFDVQHANGSSAGGFSTGDIAKPSPPSLSIGGFGAGGGSPFALNPSSLIYQYVNDKFRVRMQMLENKNKVTTLATPLLLVANNEVSRVFIGQERPIVRNISSQTTATQGVITSAPTTSIDFRPVGTTLLITPNINSDRTVTLRLLQETSSIVTGGATIPVVAGDGSVTNQPVDVVSAQSLTGTLVAKDGLSLALGGMIEESVSDQREGVPVLGRLPGVGILFRRQNTGRGRKEIIIVVRPYILSTPAEAEAVGKRVVDAHSTHPKTCELTPPQGEPIGTMNTYLPREVLRPNPPANKLEEVLRFHSVLPEDYEKLHRWRPAGTNQPCSPNWKQSCAVNYSLL